MASAALTKLLTGIASHALKKSAPQAKKLDTILDADFEAPINTKKIKADYNRTIKEQAKRKNLLDNPNKLKEYAKDKGISTNQMLNLIQKNYKNNIQVEKDLKNLISDDSFKEAEKNLKARSKKIKFKDISKEKGLSSLPEVDESVTAYKAFNKTPEEKQNWRDVNLQLTKEKVAKELGITDPKEIKNIDVRTRHRNPELEEITRDFDKGKITREEFLKLRDSIKPLKQYGTVPELRSLEDVFLSMRQGEGKDLSIIGVNKNIKPNTQVESRFDINAYSEYDNYVASIKDPSGMSYTNAVYLKDVDFVFEPAKAFKIGKGQRKSPFATIKGKWQNAKPEDIQKFAKEKINSGEWTEVGFDPASRTGFYDRSKKGGGQLLKSAEEVIQVGPMILAKKVKPFSPKELQEKAIKLETGKKVLPHEQGGMIKRNPNPYKSRIV